MRNEVERVKGNIASIRFEVQLAKIKPDEHSHSIKVF